MDNGKFLPVIAMASLADRQLAAEGRLLMDKVKQHHIPEIDKTLWLNFDALMHLRGLDNFAGEETMDAFSDFVETSYISVIRKIVEAVALPVVDCGFVPTYPLVGLDTSLEVKRAREELLKEALPEDASKVNLRL